MTLSSIERVHKRPRHDKESRLATVMVSGVKHIGDTLIVNCSLISLFHSTIKVFHLLITIFQLF